MSDEDYRMDYTLIVKNCQFDWNFLKDERSHKVCQRFYSFQKCLKEDLALTQTVFDAVPKQLLELCTFLNIGEHTSTTTRPTFPTAAQTPTPRVVL
uniref:Uncharacterized protein n=1 Tax=Ditylenchus dipsaci TaxID=166011 RepID=A0A915DSR8_9BILA